MFQQFIFGLWMICEYITFEKYCARDKILKAQEEER